MYFNKEKKYKYLMEAFNTEHKIRNVKEVGDYLGITRNYASLLLNGHKKVSLLMAYKLMSVIDGDMDFYFIGGKKDEL